MRIVVLDGQTLNPGDNPWDDIAALGQLTVYDRTPPESVVPRGRDAEVIVTNKTPLREPELAAMPHVRLIAVTATGYNIVDTDAARRRGIDVVNVPVYGTDSVAQFVFALLLHHCHNVAHHHQAVQRGQWAVTGNFSFWETPQTELAGLTLGVVGFGRIGRRVGELGHAFGMSVIACDPRADEPPAYAPFAWATLSEVFAGADIVSLHCPQTPENTRFVNRALLAQMRPGAVLVNTARGGLVDETALVEALSLGRPATALLDVGEREPLPADSPLLGVPNLVLTPHMAWASLAARRRLMAMTAANLRAFIDGHPINVVN